MIYLVLSAFLIFYLVVVKLFWWSWSIALRVVGLFRNADGGEPNPRNIFLGWEHFVVNLERILDLGLEGALLDLLCFGACLVCNDTLFLLLDLCFTMESFMEHFLWLVEPRDYMLRVIGRHITFRHLWWWNKRTRKWCHWYCLVLLLPWDRPVFRWNCPFQRVCILYLIAGLVGSCNDALFDIGLIFLLFGRISLMHLW